MFNTLHKSVQLTNNSDDSHAMVHIRGIGHKQSALTSGWIICLKTYSNVAIFERTCISLNY